MTQLDFWSEELPANHSRLPDLEKVLKTQEETLPSSIVEYLTTLSPNGLCGKTYQVSSVVQEDGILVASSGRWRNSGMGSLTECLTLSILEWHSAADVCSLSDVLETGEVPIGLVYGPAAAQLIELRDKMPKKYQPKINKILSTFITG